MTKDNLEKDGGTPKGDNPQNGLDFTNQDVYTAEQRKRHLEQLEGSKKESERKEALLVETYKNLASNDASVLKDLHQKDPKIADKVAKEFGYDDYKDIEKNFYNKNETKSGLSEDDLETWYQKRRAKDEHSEALKQAENIISKLPEEVRSMAQEYFDDMIEGKTLTRDKATKFADMATLYVSKDKIKSDKFNNLLVDAMSTGINKGNHKKEDKISDETLNLADKLGFGKFFEK